MERLKGKTILIGKEPGQGRLLIALEGTGKSVALGSPASVPASVSRCKPAEGIAHAKITVDQQGHMILTNLKSQNVTFVNGSEIASKHISLANSLALGHEKFNVHVPSVIEAAKKIAVSVSSANGLDAYGSQAQQGLHSHNQQQASSKVVKKYNISHLELIWNNLQAERKKMQAKQKRINMIRSGCGLFTMCAMPCIIMFGKIGYALTGIGIIGNLYSFIGLKNDNTSEVAERLNEEFQDRYVCPNPDCGKFLGNGSYKFLKKQYSMHCPYCKCEYVER